MLNRLKQPHVLLLIAGIIFSVLNHYGLAIDTELYQNIIDGIVFVLFGITVYKSDKDNII